MDSPTRKGASPGMPLFPLSPDRFNRAATDSSTSNSSAEKKRRAKPSAPSPTLPELELKKDPSNPNSDVFGIVARFNALDIRDHAELRRKDAAALKRAQMGREEAEGDLKRAREELRKAKKDLDEANDRERKTAKRLEIVSDDLDHQKQIHTMGIGKYEKEIRAARKEAFRSSSAMVKIQEDLKAARASLNKTRTDLDTEKGRARQREQEAFSAQYELVGVQEALQKERERCKVIETERDALKTQLKEEEVARVAAEGMIALPKSSAQQDEDDEFASPRKPKGTPAGRSRGQDAMVSRLQTEMQDLREELDGVQYAREEAEQQVDFMKMECQFRCCSCRVAEQAGGAYVHDGSLAETVFNIRPASRLVVQSDSRVDIDMEEDQSPAPVSEKAVVPSRPTTPAPTTAKQDVETETSELVVFSPQSGTFRKTSTSNGNVAADEESQLPSLDALSVTTSRPTVYINANGHAHEKEHQPQHNDHATDIDDEHDNTVVRTTSQDAQPCPIFDENEYNTITATSAEPAEVPEPDEDVYEERNVEEDEEEEDDFIIQSPTTHIAATTVTTTIPLAPLSSPVKAHEPAKMPHFEATPSRPNQFKSSVHDFAFETPSLPNNNKENADPHPRPKTPTTASAHTSAFPLDPGTPFDAASTPWTPLAATGLTREEAIERLRARRERERARTGADDAAASTAAAAAKAAAATPKRAASQGNGAARRGAATPGRRDISAPEARSAKR